MTNYYQTLNLSKGCTEKDIKTAYRKLAHQWHPDKNKAANARVKFIEIHAAYEILIDPLKRKVYDLNFNINLTVAVRQPTAGQKARYQQFEKEANVKAEYFSRLTFDKFMTSFLRGIDKVHTGCAYIFISGWAIFFVWLGFYGLIKMISNINLQFLQRWQGIVSMLSIILVSSVLFYLAYRIFKKVAKYIG